ncbi:pyruvate formate-lyase activating enzyme [hydrocarbon metagenome]|uniref:Pyruvate formate-lyase activating enzyme n=1 Tax=hydrocarbon metagenome TaxID=938273 RepID=A0A0W8EAB7_9ZZZZ
MLGRIHSIDTFSTLDGPGIRTVIFMQGCSLRCKYCHNPDTWSRESADSRDYTPEALMHIIARGKPYFDASRGGITFSGGEPLLQHRFIKDIFVRCREIGISTAFDSSLYISPRIVEDLLGCTDLVLADIKQMDRSRSLELVGAANELNLGNIELINNHQVSIWIRYVVVPGWTDDRKDVEAMARFIAPLAWVKRVDLLPYHALGRHKWPMLGMEYELADLYPPSREQMLELKRLVEEHSNKLVVIHE